MTYCARLFRYQDEKHEWKWNANKKLLRFISSFNEGIEEGFLETKRFHIHDFIYGYIYATDLQILDLHISVFYKKRKAFDAVSFHQNLNSTIPVAYVKKLYTSLSYNLKSRHHSAMVFLPHQIWRLDHNDLLCIKINWSNANFYELILWVLEIVSNQSVWHLYLSAHVSLYNPLMIVTVTFGVDEFSTLCLGITSFERCKTFFSIY